MRLLYLSTWDFSNEMADGVCKKIYAQLKVFEERGYSVDFIYIKDGQVFYRKREEESVIARVGKIRKTPAYIKMYKYLKNEKYDCVYNRYGMADNFYNRVIRKLWKNGAQIYIEVPSYPYEGERAAGILHWIMFKWDILCRSRLKRYVRRIITYTDFDKIFHINTIKIINGIDISSIKPIRNIQRDEKTIHLLIVTLMMRHHGYERLIDGIYEYYKNGGQRDLCCHFVGDGEERNYYESLVEKYNLHARVKFYGMKTKDELDAFYEFADFGVTAMGLYKDNIFLSSELKSREYLAKGLPLISGCQIDIFRGRDEWFYHKFPEDATPINIQQVIDIYDEMYKTRNKESIIQEIRNFAENMVNISQTMIPVIESMENK